MKGTTAMRHRRVVLAVAACVTALVMPAVAGSPSAHAAAARSMTVRGTSAPPRRVEFRAQPPAGSRPAAQRPFHPRSASGFQAAKRAAEAGKTGRRSGVIGLTPASPASSSGPAAANASSGKSLLVQDAFPLTDKDTQVSWHGNDQNVAPPDTQLGAGPDRLLQMVNSSGSVWLKTGALQAHTDLNNFFGLAPDETFTDPRVQYDDNSGIWFASGLSFAATPTTTRSTVLLAASATDDPAGAWSVYTVSASATLIQDQPKFGVTSDKIVMTWNDFDSSNRFQGQETLAIQKSDLVAGVPFASSAMFFGGDPSRFNLIPALQQDFASPGYLVYNIFDGNGASTGQAGVITVTGTPDAADVSWTEADFDIAPTSPPPGAKQGATGPLLATNDDAFTTATVSNGNLWLAGNDACMVGADSTPRSCVRLIQLSLPGIPGVLQDVDLGQQASFMFFPAVALNKAGDMVVVFTKSGDSSYAGVYASGQPAVGPGAFATQGTIQLGLGAYSCGPSCGQFFNGNRWGDYSGAALDPVTGDVWVAGEYATATTAPAVTNANWGTAAGRVAFTTSALKTASSTLQYRLTGSNGSNWIVMDSTRLALTVKPTSNVRAILDANADLWTANAGVNQDLGIFVNVNGGAATLVAWKESGGKAGTFSPNAAFVHAVMDLTAQTTYDFRIRWKSNIPASGATIFAGAGAGPVFSPTRLTVRTVESGSTALTKVSTKQYSLSTSQSWTPMDSSVPAGLFVDIPATAGAVAIIHANADLWTANPGFNQDLGIFVTPTGGSETLKAWKESGGRSGTFSPNAAFAQTVLSSATVASGARVTLKWKSNVQASGGTIYAGAGLGPAYSPTRLTVELVPASSVYSSASPPTQQYALAFSDGNAWFMPDPSALHLLFNAPASDCLAVIGVNMDLWTENAGVNQDIGIKLQTGSITYSPAVLAWKESGGSAGTFSPNAAYLETVLPVYQGLSYDLQVVWKANHDTSGTIHANAGLSPNFSPSRITAQLICS
jgi:hypothetical protein